MHTRILDDFSDPSGWSPIASGQARLTLSGDSGPRSEQSALRMDFDFGGGGGFVVARKALRLDLPESFAILLDVRAEAPPNAFELKLVDSSGANVWLMRDPAFDFRSGWRSLRIHARDLPFGWGPAGGGAPSAIGAVEIAVAAGPGGAGSLWLADLRLEDRSPSGPPRARDSDSPTDVRPLMLPHDRPQSCWQPRCCPAWLELDFGDERDYGGLVLHWTSAIPRAFSVLASEDGCGWRTLYVAPQAAGLVNRVHLPHACSRRLRLTLDSVEGPSPPGLIGLTVEPELAARTVADFFHHMAADQRRGLYPRWLYREQSYWTPVDLPDGTVPALLNEDGMVEVRRAGWSVEPFLLDIGDGRGDLMTWADCDPQPGLLVPTLPIPVSRWTRGELGLTVSVFATGSQGRAWLILRYRLENRGPAARALRLYAAVRPFQVSPPWQGWRDIGGLSRIDSLSYDDGAVRVNDKLALIPLTAPSGFGAACFDQGSIVDYLALGELPAAQSASDSFGYASAALAFDLSLAPGEAREVLLAAPLGTGQGERPETSGLPSAADVPALLAAELARWSEVLGAVELDLPPEAQDYADACRAALAHVLICRNGPALQPGARRYTRSWIRDGAVMAAALLRFGRPQDAADFISWYAQFQTPDGNVPCCVDDQGADWLPEYDSFGQLCFAVVEHWRFTGDLETARALWPAVLGALDFMEGLRAQRFTDDYRTGAKAACFGLLPESASHEGYLAHPVHAYWDDFWALRGLKDAVDLAQALGDEVQSARLAELRDDFRKTLHASILRTMDERGIDYVPGSVEWADPDPSATAVALTLIDESHRLPPEALKRTFDMFMERFRAMHGDQPVDWVNYTPYEVRIVGALVRLGRRSDAHELLRFLLAERRPPVWSQWPEIAWRDPRSPGHQGDLPHAWIGAEYCLAIRDLFVYERERDQSLAVAAGIPADWLEAWTVVARGLRTWYGSLDLEIERRDQTTIAVRLNGDLRLPPGGIRLALPLPGPLTEVLIDGAPSVDFDDTEIHVRSVPAEVLAICAAAE